LLAGAGATATQLVNEYFIGVGGHPAIRDLLHDPWFPHIVSTYGTPSEIRKSNKVLCSKRKRFWAKLDSWAQTLLAKQPRGTSKGIVGILGLIVDAVATEMKELQAKTVDQYQNILCKRASSQQAITM
jgi:hypothetical protein